MNEALVQRLVNLRELTEQLEHAQGLPTARFAAAVGNASPTRSGLEDLVLRKIRARGHRPPKTNVRVAGYEVDGFYADRNLVIEIDSNRYHQTPAARRRDARKQAALEARGYPVFRIREDPVDEDLDQLEEHHLGRV